MQQDPTFAVSSVLVTSSPSTKTECIVLCKGTGCHAGKLSGEVGTRQKSNENKHNTFGESMLSGLTGVFPDQNREEDRVWLSGSSF